MICSQLYDCHELLNIVLARPIASPTTYIQIKGRGTRLYTFPDGTTKKKFIIHDFCEVVEYFEEKYDYTAPLPLYEPADTAAQVDETYKDDTFREDDKKETYKGMLTSKAPDAMAMTEFIEVGPDGEKVDRMMYQSKWKEKIQEVAKTKPELIVAAKTDNFTDELMEYLNTEVLNLPVEYFNETNLARVYRIFADITDFIKEALGISRLPTQKEQLEKMIDFLKVEYNLNLHQIRLLKILIEQITQSPKYAEQFEKGDFKFLDSQPFATYGGAGGYVAAFGENTKPIFFNIRQSPPFKLARMR